MTEANWLSTDPTPMVDFLRSKASDRKVRLFICALARRAWPTLTEDGRRAVGVGERLADGQCGEDERAAAFEAAGGHWSALYTQADGLPAKALVTENLDYVFADAAVSALRVADEQGDYILEATPEWEAAESAAQCHLLSDLFGHPFRPMTVDPRWLTSTVVALAETIYQDRAFDRLPILADAIQDAGCEDADLLAHCRGPGLHVRGCWAVDLLTGRG